jgi:hypothetical protein
MSISTLVADLRVDAVETRDHRLVVRIRDGREISTPLAWFPRLAAATPEQRANWRTIGAGTGIHWPDLDEDLSVEGLLRGERAP